MKTMTIANQKGGCGKTITSVNLAGAFHTVKKKVLFIDMDPQGHGSSAFGINRTEPSLSSYAIFDAFLNNTRLNIQTLMRQKYTNLWVIPSHISLATIEQKLSGIKDALSILSRALDSQGIKDFDYIIIDTPPSLGFLTLNSIHAANRLIVPLDISLFSLNGVSQINEILSISKNLGLNTPSVNFLITLFDKRSNFAKNFLQKLREEFGGQLFKTVIRGNIKLREAALLGKVIFEHNPSCNGAQDYMALVEEISPEIKKRPIDLKSIYSDLEKSLTCFSLYAPEAKTAYIAGTFNDWATNELSKMERQDDGTWIKKIPIPEGAYHYKFVVDGIWRPDPQNKATESDRFGGVNSVLSVKNT